MLKLTLSFYGLLLWLGIDRIMLFQVRGRRADWRPDAEHLTREVGDTQPRQLRF